MNNKFYIYKYSYLIDTIPNLEYVPMLTRRKMSPLTKIAISVMNECYLNEIENIIFSSQYGELQKLTELTEQYLCCNTVSPLGFTNSVHNTSAGAFTLLNKINQKYNAVSAGENSLSAGLIEAITEQKSSLICCADAAKQDDFKGVALSLGKTDMHNSDCIEVTFETNPSYTDDFKQFIKFLDKDISTYTSKFLKLKRM